MKLHKVLLSEQDIRELIQMYVSSIKKNNLQRQERYKSMIYVRLADLGLDRPHIKNMVNDLTDIDTEKDVIDYGVMTMLILLEQQKLL